MSQAFCQKISQVCSLAGAATLQLSLRHRGVLQDNLKEQVLSSVNHPRPGAPPPSKKKSNLGHVILLWLSTLHARQGCCYSSEQLLHIVTCLGRGLYEHHVQLLGLKKV